MASSSSIPRYDYVVPCDFCKIDWRITGNKWGIYCGTDGCAGRIVLVPTADDKKYVREICSNGKLRYHRAEASDTCYICDVCGKHQNITDDLVEIVCGQKVYGARLDISKEDEIEELKTKLQEMQVQNTGQAQRISAQHNELRRKNERIENLLKEQERQSKEIESIYDKLDVSMVEVNEKEEELQGFRKQLEKANEEHSRKRNNLMEELEDANQKISILEREKKEQANEIDFLQKRIALHKEEIDIRKEEIQTLRAFLPSSSEHRSSSSSASASSQNRSKKRRSEYRD